MEHSHFFANIARLKLIQRWPLMRTVTTENVQEHSHQVATVAHILALIKNKKFNGNVNPEKAALVALYHDASEVLTGDLPSPIKYHNEDIANAYKKIEAVAEKSLLQMLPAEFREDFSDLLLHENIDPEMARIVKSADVICGLIKTLEELSAGNHEFEKAKKNINKTLQKYRCPEVDYFMDMFLPSFSLNFDEISSPL
ncbi:5'-deoxynucleotidase [Psychrosphaera sp. 1_MG-2023]|uniref:5'-deoxynucleotidase n=1 Tax=unclassified Psychrosphaera TaxID=2641570 RepID=UPI0020910B85|nr:MULTISPECIES: 5'-deoxynucleotidase [unclassified Psychrosphaera]MDO6718045.1 5'-deoxynucleotidase [Psychrosphaera sp. 1_MG-2023]